MDAMQDCQCIIHAIFTLRLCTVVPGWDGKKKESYFKFNIKIGSIYNFIFRSVEERIMSWQLTLPDAVNLESLEDWSNDLRKQGIPKGAICNFLLTQSDIKAIRTFLKTEYKISDVMAERNLRGKQLEKTGNIEEAIPLYEANIAVRFPDKQPYDRLRVIYTNQKRYGDAIRVSQAFVDVANSLLNAGSQCSDILPQRDRFINYIERLEQAKNRSKSTGG